MHNHKLKTTVTRLQRNSPFYCYVRSLKMFIVVSNTALYVQIHEHVVALFFDVIAKYDVIV